MITVIGGAGFVGTALCQQLSNDNIDFEILDLKVSQTFPSKTKRCDIREYSDLIKSISGNVIINLAAVHRDDASSEEYEITNVGGMRNLTKACVELKINKIIFTSSVAVYGFASPETDELGRIDPFNDYGQTKFRAEQLLVGWRKESPLNCMIILRPVAMFGPGARGNIFKFFSAIVSGVFCKIGPMNNKKSILYVENAASLIKHAALKINHDLVVNVVDEPNIPIEQLINKVRKQVSVRLPVITLPVEAGFLIAKTCDLFNKWFSLKLPLTTIRVKKLIAPTTFVSSNVKELDFVYPFSIDEGLEKTLHQEFIGRNVKQTFHTE